MGAYRAAIRHALADGASTVLDLGSGSGVLGLIAAQEGAARVYAVDIGPIIGPATDVAAASGFGSVIVPLQASSTEVDLPEPVDVVVCDQIGGFVHDAGVLEDFADARLRHLAPGASSFPPVFACSSPRLSARDFGNRSMCGARARPLPRPEWPSWGE